MMWVRTTRASTSSAWNGHIVDAADFETPVLLAGRFHHGQERSQGALGLFVRL